MSILKRLSMKLFTLSLVLALAGPSTAANLKRAYVTNTGSNTVSVIDTTTNTVVATIAVGNVPFDAAVAPNGKHVYVANGFGPLSVIDTTTNTVTATIPVGRLPQFLAVAPDGHHVYVTNVADNTMSVIATASNTVTATITVGAQPNGVAVTPDSARVYVVNTAGNDVAVIDAATNAVLTTVPVGSRPTDIAITPNGKHAYVTNLGDTVSVIETATNTVTATITVGQGPVGVASTPDSKHVYVANANSNTVSVIDTSTNTVIATVAAGNAPIDVAVTADGHQAYVTNVNSNNVSVIATATNTVTAIVAAGNGPQGIATQPRHTKKNWQQEDNQADEGNSMAAPTHGMSGAAISAAPIRLSLQNAPAGGRVMNQTAPPTQNLALNLLSSPSWYTDQPYTGTFEKEAVFEVHMPCTLGLGVLVTYTLAATDVNGGSVHTLGQTTQLLSLCVGEQTVTIPVATPFDLNNQLLKFTISSTLSANLNLQLGQNTFLLSTDYVGEP
jgi:YVTN family beta-propeller protein